MKLGHLFFIVVAFVLLSGCGYKPSVQYAKEQLGDTVFVNLLINLEDPRNAAIIKDSMNEIIMQRIGSRVVTDASKAEAILNLSLKSVSMGVVQYDSNGYAKVYKAKVSILVDVNKNGEKKKFTVSGDYDFNIDAGAEISDANRFNAIKEASAKALTDVISKLSVYSFKKEQ